MKPELLREVMRVFPLHQTFYIQDVVINYMPSYCDTPCADLGNLSLAILGLPAGCGDYTYPLNRVSKTRWVYMGLIELYFSFSQIDSVTVAVSSDSFNDIGFLQLQRAEFPGHPEIIEIMGGEVAADTPQIMLSFSLCPFRPPRDGLPPGERNADLARRIDSIIQQSLNGDIDPNMIDETVATLQEASRAWAGYSRRDLALKEEIKWLFKRPRFSHLDEIIALHEVAVGLSIAPAPGRQIDISALGRDINNYAKLLSLRERDDLDVDQFIEAAKLGFIFPESSLVWSPTSAAIKVFLRALHSRSLRTRQPCIADCDEAVDAARVAFNGEFLESPPHAYTLCLLANTLLYRFQENGCIGDLEAAKSILESAIDIFITPEDGLYGETLALHTQVLAFAIADDDVAGINSAISECHRALQYLQDPADAEPRSEVHSALSALSHKHRLLNTEPDDGILFEIFGVAETMSAEMANWDVGTPGGVTHSCRSYAEALLAVIRMFLDSDNSPSPEQIRKALASTEAAMENFEDVMPHSQRFIKWNTLGRLHENLFQLTGDQEDLDRATDAFRLAGTSQGPNSSGDQANANGWVGGVPKILPLFGKSEDYVASQKVRFGELLAARHRITEDISDIQESISVFRACLESLPPGHPEESSITLSLGLALIQERGESVDLGLSLLLRAASIPTAPPMDRIHAARRLAWSSVVITQELESSIEAYDIFMKLFVTISNTKKTAEGRYEFLSEYSKIVRLAASSAVYAGRSDKALEWMEQGRGWVWNRLRNLRSPLEELRTASPHLAERLERVSQYLEDVERHVSRPAAAQSRISILGSGEKTALHDGAAQYFKLAKEREDILETIQNTVPGFENFLRPLPCSAWMNTLPESGYVIIVNVHAAFSDALVLRKGLKEPHHILLPGFSFETASRVQKLLQETMSYYQLRTRGDGNDRAIRPSCGVFKNKNPLQDVLRALWIHVAKPIVDALELSSADPPTRVWWCPTGPLTFLPLHAAGIYSGDGAVALADYVVSSYIPTVAVLAERVQAPRSVPVQKSGILLVSVPEGKGARSCPIPGTTTEVNTIHDLLSTRSTVPSLKLQGENATVEAGLRRMESHNFIHLACHAKQDVSQPLQSGFLFYNNLLDLATIIKCNLKDADFAFLSACQTSTGHEQLSEEAVHLAAGMLAAGYRGVVATMWSIPDHYAPKVAENFYQDLLSRGSTTPGLEIDSANAAYSIHHAVKKLRAEIGDSEDKMLAWVPYVHFGL